MSPNRSSLPDDRRQPGSPDPGSSVSWGTRQSESEGAARAEGRTRPADGPARCPSCGSEKTTVVQVADRGPGSSIRRGNPGYTCFSCGTGWTVTVGDDRELDDHSRA